MKEISLLIGTVIAIIAILKTIIEPSLTKNREKWKKILDIVNDEDFKVVLSGTTDLTVSHERLIKIDCLIYDYKEKRDHTQFNSLLASLYKKYWDELVSAHEKYRNLVQVDKWECNKNKDWYLNKSAFEDSRGIPRNYAGHILVAETEALNMRQAFKKLEALSDIDIWQLLIAEKVVNRRAG